MLSLSRRLKPFLLGLLGMGLSSTGEASSYSTKASSEQEPPYNQPRLAKSKVEKVQQDLIDFSKSDSYLKNRKFALSK